MGVRACPTVDNQRDPSSQIDGTGLDITDLEMTICARSDIMDSTTYTVGRITLHRLFEFIKFAPDDHLMMPVHSNHPP